MDYLAELGALALASRLRRLLGRLTRDGARVYARRGIEFEIRWFPVLHLVSRRGPLSVTGIAQALGLTHPAVVQVVSGAVEGGLLSSTPCIDDRRVRMITLTHRGRRLMADLEPLWQAFADAGQELAVEGSNDLLAAIHKTEVALDRQPLFDRIMDRLGD